MGMRVGIDLGTTFSAVARIEPNIGKPEIIRNSFGSAITPSVLYFERNGNILCGEDAKNMQAAGDPNAIAFFKRSMGNERFSVNFWGKEYSATDLSAILLNKLKEEAERQTGEKIDGAVITVPAYFAHKERTATIEAGKKAGLDVIAIINEPTAAAFAYGLNERDTEQTVMIYDLGGGTFDVTLAEIDKKQITIIGSDGNHELGGKDWDDCIARYIADEFAERYGVDISDDPDMAASLMVMAENVKKQLTSKDVVRVPITCASIRGTVEISERVFEDISKFLIEITKDVTERLMKSVGVEWSRIDGVILVGGSTRMRMVRKYVREMSGKELLGGVNVDEAVAIGAAIRANINERGEVLPVLGEACEKVKYSNTSIQGAKAVTDVTAHSLGMLSISADGERYVNSVIIKKNTKIPTGNTRSFKFRTRAKNNELEVYILQGEFINPLDNTVINKYMISEIEKTMSSTSVIDVTYQYNSDGVIEVAAVQKETQKQLPIKVEPVPEDMSWMGISPKNSRMGRGNCQAVILLTVDLSGSMSGHPLAEARKVMKKFVDEMDSRFIKIGLIPFANCAECELSPTDDYCKVKQAIDRLEVSDKYGYGNSAHPFDLSYKKLMEAPVDAKYIIVLTDGMWSYADKAVAMAEKCHSAGIEIMALGFGNADYNFLQKIASTNDFASLTNIADLEDSFSKIAQTIEESTTDLAEGTWR